MIRIRGVDFPGKILALLFVLLAGLSAARYWEVGRTARATSGAGGLTPRPELLVDPGWLEKNLTDPALRVIDLRPPEQYGQGHIPGAVPMAREALQGVVAGIPGMLPPIPHVEQALRRAGIGADTIVVAYDSANGLLAARLFWVLDYLGQGGGRVLDGGWAGWVQGGHPVSTDTALVPPGDFRARADAEKIADLAWMRGHINAPGVVYVDARSAEEFAGSKVYARRGGHIPGAVSMDWHNHLENGRLRDPAVLARIYRELGVMPGQDAVVYCQSLVRAAHSYFTLRWLGYPRVRGYDGSWSEWGNHSDTPVETGPPAALRQEPAAGGVAVARELEVGLSPTEVRRILGDPSRVESQNPCWGELAVWHYDSLSGAADTLRLKFVDAKLQAIEPGR